VGTQFRAFPQFFTSPNPTDATTAKETRIMEDRRLIPQQKDADLSISWHALSPDEILEKLNTGLLDGLTSAEAARRLEQYGPNQLDEKPRPGFFRLVLDQLNNFVVILLIVAALISLLLGETVDAAAIFAIVILNSILGVVQESRAEAALAALKKLAAPDAQVLRDGHRTSVPAYQLVPGDIVLLEAGNFVPADLRLLEAANLRVEEAALTGESVPVQKNVAQRLEANIPLGDQKNTAFMGTVINYGRGKGVVVSTGMRTQLGLIANMLQNVDTEETPLQRNLDQLGKLLGTGALAICGLVFLLGLFQAVQTLGLSQLFQSEAGLQQLVNLFMIAVSLAIAAVPEGLPAVVTISLALGMREMVKRHALIRKLASVETLGSATVICSDKTGTLTQNEMTVTRLWVDGKTFEITGSGYSVEGQFCLDDQPVDLQRYPGASTVLWVGVLNNDAQLEQIDNNGQAPSFRMVGDPTEGSILVAAAKAGAYAPSLNQAYPRKNEIPFDSVRKRMVTIHHVAQQKDEDISPLYGDERDLWYTIAVKGAPDVVLNLCTQYQTLDDQVQPLDDAMRQAILNANDGLTHQALRVLGLAYRVVPAIPSEVDSQELEKDLVFAGMVGMIDPARPEVSTALHHAQQAGIRTVMITGDYPNTARAIAEAIGLLQPGHKVMTGVELNAIDDEALKKEVEVTDVFARVSPEHKMRIVDALRANNQVVAMTGDGVNDAPAIKRANIGIAMGITGTDVAKETADMVLTDDNYVSIVSAIEQGRIIYSNIRKFVYYLLSCNMAEIATIFLGTLFGWGSPLTAIQLLWLNLVTDGAPALALATEKGDPDIMVQKPRPPKEPIINRYMRRGIAVQTVAITAATLGAFWIGRSTGEHIEFAETMAFVTLSCSELLRAFTARSEYFPLLKIGAFGNRLMNYAVISSLALILAVVYVPFLQQVFNTEPLGLAQWIDIAPLLLLPSVAAEVTKLVFAPKTKK
jgi:P-type Ca2+ transporter type 2C